MYTGLNGGPNAKARGPKGKNLAHREAIQKEATIKIHSTGVLGGTHMGGHSDVAGMGIATNVGGVNIKTPVAPKTPTTTKTPTSPGFKSLKNK